MILHTLIIGGGRRVSMHQLHQLRLLDPGLLQLVRGGGGGGGWQPGPGRVQLVAQHQRAAAAEGLDMELETKAMRRFSTFHNHGEGPYWEYWAFYWLMKAPTSAFTFKTLLRHNAKQALIHNK